MPPRALDAHVRILGQNLPEEKIEPHFPRPFAKKMRFKEDEKIKPEGEWAVIKELQSACHLAI